MGGVQFVCEVIEGDGNLDSVAYSLNGNSNTNLPSKYIQFYHVCVCVCVCMFLLVCLVGWRAYVWWFVGGGVLGSFSSSFLSFTASMLYILFHAFEQHK